MMKEASTHHTITASRVGKWLHHLPTQKVQMNSVGKQNRVCPPYQLLRPNLQRPYLTRQFIQHAIDIFKAVRTAKTFGNFDRFVNHHFVRYFKLVLQLIRRHEQDAMLNR